MATGREVPRGSERQSGRSHRAQACAVCRQPIEPGWRFCPTCGAPAPQLRRGEVVDERYEVLDLLNQHGAREVYSARHLHLDEVRVLKILHGELFEDDAQLVRFHQEAKLASRIRHPNVAALHDHARLGARSFYTAWEYLQGETAAQRLRDRGPLDPLEVTDIAIQTANGLAAIHGEGIVHRHISPHNLMISEAAGASREGAAVRARIIDFGIATALAADDSEGALRRGFADVRYASPEQVSLAAGETVTVDERSDIYSLGITLFELLTGRLPFDADTPELFALQHIRSEPRRLRDTRPEVHEALDAIIARCLAKDPDQRYATAAHLRDDLVRARAAMTGPVSGSGSGGSFPHRDPERTPSVAMPEVGREDISAARKEEVISPAEQSPDMEPPVSATLIPMEPAHPFLAAEPAAIERSATMTGSPLERDIVPEAERAAASDWALTGAAATYTSPWSASESPLEREIAPVPSSPATARDLSGQNEYNPLRSKKLPVPLILFIVLALILGAMAVALLKEPRRARAATPERTSTTDQPAPVQEHPAETALPQTDTVPIILPPNVATSGGAEGALEEGAIAEPAPEVPQRSPTPAAPPGVENGGRRAGSSPAPAASPRVESVSRRASNVPTPAARRIAPPVPPMRQSAPSSTTARRRITVGEASTTLLRNVRSMRFYDIPPECLRTGGVEYRNEGYTIEIRSRSCNGDGVEANTLLGVWRVDAYTSETFVRNGRGRFVTP